MVFHCATGPTGVLLEHVGQGRLFQWLAWRAGLSLMGYSLRPKRSIPPTLLVPVAVAPADSQSSEVLCCQSLEWHCHFSHAWKGCIRSAFLFPPSISGFDLPLTVVSKDQGISIPF